MMVSGESSAEIILARPGVQKVPSDKVALFQCRDFVPACMRDQLMALIDTERRPSTIADDNGDAYFRTSETCDLPGLEPVVRKLENMLTDFIGIDPAYGEPLQGQRYAVGQEFKPHCDWFNPGGQDYEKYCAIAGQRTWTVMIYLNDVEAGGGTRFKAIKKTFQPQAGKLLTWNNRRPDSTPNPSTIHHGMKVRKGVKYVITKWYREKLWG